MSRQVSKHSQLSGLCYQMNTNAMHSLLYEHQLLHAMLLPLLHANTQAEHGSCAGWF